jgi:hypothetical protein
MTAKVVGLWGGGEHRVQRVVEQHGGGAHHLVAGGERRAFQCDVHLRKALLLAPHHGLVQFQHREPPAHRLHLVHQWGEEADHAQMVVAGQPHIAQGVARRRRLVAHLAPDGVGHRVDGGQSQGSLHRGAAVEPARQLQGVGSGQALAAVSTPGTGQRVQRVAQQHVGQAERAVLQLDGAELRVFRRLIPGRIGRDVQMIMGASLLDTDLYKFTMMQVVLHQFPGCAGRIQVQVPQPGAGRAAWPAAHVERDSRRDPLAVQLHFQDATSWPTCARCVSSRAISSISSACSGSTRNTSPSPPCPRRDRHHDPRALAAHHPVRDPGAGDRQRGLFPQHAKGAGFRRRPPRLDHKIALLHADGLRELKIADYGTRRRFSGLARGGAAP